MTAMTQRIKGWFGAAPAADALPVRLGPQGLGRSSSQPVRLSDFDHALIWVVVALLAWGLVMVYSASIALPDNPRFSKYLPTHFLTRHVVAICFALIAGFITVQIPVALWERYAPWVFVISLVLLVLVLIPGIGKVVYGARRWIPLGVMNFQPSELAKFGIALYAANYMMRKMDARENFFQAVTPMAISLAFVRPRGCSR